MTKLLYKVNASTRKNSKENLKYLESCFQDVHQRGDELFVSSPQNDMLIINEGSKWPQTDTEHIQEKTLNEIYGTLRHSAENERISTGISTNIEEYGTNYRAYHRL